MIAPIGVVNACNPAQAALDAYDVGRIKDVRGVPGNYALEVAAAVAAGVAEGLKPTRGFDAIIRVALAELSPVPREEVEQGLTWAAEAGGDWRELRPLYADNYRGRPSRTRSRYCPGALACSRLLPIHESHPAPRQLRPRHRLQGLRRRLPGRRDRRVRIPPLVMDLHHRRGAGDRPVHGIGGLSAESAQGLTLRLLGNIAGLKEQIAAVESQA